MCGIFAAIYKDEAIAHMDEICRATRIVQHRGPDSEKFYQNGSVGFGFRRLSILDLNKRSDQPMSSMDYTIVFNGAIFNYLELRNELSSQGYIFVTESDTEVVIAAYDHWGEQCVTRFNGMWAFIIHDSKNNRIYGARDRYGIKPLYYFSNKDGLFLASEIKQFTTLPGWVARLNYDRAHDFLNSGYHDHTNQTMFEGVEQIPKASYFTYDLSGHYGNKLKFSIYYELGENGQIYHSSSNEMLTFKSLFYDSVSMRLRSDVKFGSALSGGIDSSAVVAAMSSFHSETIATFTSDFKEEQFSEKKFVQSLCKNFNLKQEFIYPQLTDLFSDLKKVTWHQDEPIAGPAVWAQNMVYDAVQKSDIRVILNGQGSDELLAGYEKFYLPHFKGLLKANPLKFLTEFNSFRQLHNISWTESWTNYSESTKPTNSSKSWLNISPEKLTNRFIRPNEHTIKDVSINLFNNIGLPILLHYEDRNSMAYGVESRLPFLDFRLIEMGMALPDRWKINKGKRKYILREAMKDQLPEMIYKRYDKMAFETPLSKWLKEEKRLFRKKIQESIELCKPLIDRSALSERFENDWWRIIAFAEWVKVFDVNLSTP